MDVWERHERERDKMRTSEREKERGKVRECVSVHVREPDVSKGCREGQRGNRTSLSFFLDHSA